MRRVAGAAVVLTLAACQADRGDLLIVDESGAPVSAAVLIVGDTTFEADDAGRIRVDPVAPMAGVLTAPGFLDEPLLIGASDAGAEVTVRLWASEGRWALHAGGDVMLGRRYLEPTTGDPLLDPADPATGAEHVVAELAPLFSTADVSSVNLETVVSDLPLEDAYVGKRFLLNTPPQALAALNALGVDVVDLANNHARDWMDVGVTETAQALDDAALPWFGAADGPTGSDAPIIVDVDGVRVGFIGYTTVNGDFVNDRYPVDGDPVPEPLDDEEAWQYEARSWGYQGTGWSAPVAERRIGSAWRVFSDAESDLDTAERAGAWASLVAVYPELQDWVARRGHGGAAPWSTAASTQAIADLDAQVDVTVVQIHGGFQFQPTVSGFLDQVTRDSVDAGADLVVAHHPHVLQGAAFHRGVPIVHSLGNLVFDQDFLATFHSAWLRTVWEGDTLLEARLMPVELVDYRPVHVTDATSRKILRDMWERSDLGGTSERTDGGVRVVRGERDEALVPATITWDRHTGVLTERAPSAGTVEVRVPGSGIADLPTDGLVNPRIAQASDDILVGRDLLHWGHIDDHLAEVAVDTQPSAGTHFYFDDMDKVVIDRRDGQALMLWRDMWNESELMLRLLARIPLVEHRLWTDEGEPVDPDVSYAVRLVAKHKGRGDPRLRLVFYDFQDTDPTKDPASTTISDVLVDLDVGSGWDEVVVDIDPAWLVSEDGRRANMVLPYVVLEPPGAGNSWLGVDDLQFLELRKANAMPALPGAWDVLRNVGDQRADVSVAVVE